MIDIRNALYSLLGRRERYRVGLVGIGTTALALLDTLCDMPDVDVSVRDENSSAHLREGVNARLITGATALTGIFEDVLILSPSVRRERQELREAERRGVILTSECELFFSECPRTLGVTGSDGKSTTTALAAKLLRASGYSACFCGNIGVPYSLVPSSDIYVSELSSFNLSYLSPHLLGAVITNITPNHLNWHSSFSEYEGAKMNILKNAGRRVLSADDPISYGHIKNGFADAVFSIGRSYKEMKLSLPGMDFFTLEGGYIAKNGEPISNTGCYIRREKHNLSNMLASLALTDGLIKYEAADAVFSSFEGLSDRCEPIGRLGNTLFYNSSIDTSPLRCAATLTGLNKSVKLLLGGRGKGLSYEPLIEPLSKYARAVAVYGEIARDIENLFQSRRELRGIPLSVSRYFDGAFCALTEELHDGDTVLLSPAATAYGEFRSYKERAERYRTLVKELINSRKI